jgi:hypothetical protein
MTEDPIHDHVSHVCFAEVGLSVHNTVGPTFAQADGIRRLDLDLDTLNQTRLNPVPILSGLFVPQLGDNLRRSDKTFCHTPERGQR